jgi:Icc protein
VVAGGARCYAALVRLAFVSDIHLNFISRGSAQRFLEKVGRRADAVAVGGDIHEAPELREVLIWMADVLQKQTYFVLGNHDFYDSTFAKVKTAVRMACEQSPYLRWLDEAGVISLSDETALCGVGGWYDGRAGRYDATFGNEMTDFQVIADLVSKSKAERLELFMTMADSASQTAQDLLEEAFERHSRVVFVTHFPPWPQACLYHGKVTSDLYLPFYCNSVLGGMLERAMRERPQRELLVLCGHTHGRARYNPLPNLECRVAAATYGSPTIFQPILEV